MLTNRVHETQLVQSGRAELVDEPAHVGERRPEIGARLDHQNVCRRLGLEVVSRGSQFEHHAGERRTETVMQIATKSPPFLLTSRHKLRPSPLKVGCQPNRVRRHADLASKIFEQLAIGGRKRLSRRARSKQQLADNLQAFMDAIVKAKPSAAKGHYIRSVTVSSTMGPGVRVDPAGYHQ